VRRVATLALLSLALLGNTASARTVADDVAAIVFLSQGVGVTQVQGLTFGIVIEVEGSTGVARPVTIRTTLPNGLSFATTPVAGDGCIGDTSVVCTKTMAFDIAGAARASWRWELRAAAPGSYTLTVTASSDEPDPNPQNNTGTLQFQVIAGTGGGGSITVKAGAARVVPDRPRAGAIMTASVRVTADGRAVRPSRVVCAATAAGRKVRGTPRAATGAASCSFRTPVSARGKVIRGAIRFTVGGRSFTRRFSVRLR
jgi:Domain of unknown function DUF11